MNFADSELKFHAFLVKTQPKNSPSPNRLHKIFVSNFDIKVCVPSRNATVSMKISFAQTGINFGHWSVYKDSINPHFC